MSEDKKLPTASDVINEIAGNKSASEISDSEKDYLEQFQNLSTKGQIEQAHLKGIVDHYKHKRIWSVFLIVAIGAMLLFQGVLLVFVGIGIWDFAKYDWLLPALLAQNLTQVVGLSVWAVKYLFSDISNQI